MLLKVGCTNWFSAKHSVIHTENVSLNRNRTKTHYSVAFFSSCSVHLLSQLSTVEPMTDSILLMADMHYGDVL